MAARADAVAETGRPVRHGDGGFEIPEGLLVPWADTQCKRALDEGRACTTDIPAVWGDSDAARSFGIQVQVSVPVEAADGRVWGTLCAADSLAAADVESHLPTMRLFARLIGAEVETATQVVERVRNALTFNMCWQSTNVDVGGSVGFAVSEDQDGLTLLADADAAMHAVKRIGLVLGRIRS